MKIQQGQMLAGCLLLMLTFNAAYGQQARTGTNLNSKSIPSEVLVLKEPDEVSRIRKQIVNGRKNEALKAAVAYLEKVRHTALCHETRSPYYALNAYCTVLTGVGRVEKAIAACSSAMAYEPTKWSAVNNRGTAKLVGGMLQEALMDYRIALDMVGADNANGRETIQYNFSLAEARL